VNEKKISDMTDEELAFLLSTTGPNTTLGGQLKLDLQLRMGKRQAESADALVVATKGLVAATSRLVWATWGLVLLTAVLAGSTAFQMFVEAGR
jgi:hypothetical protein